jgi:hypothetical protein
MSKQSVFRANHPDVHGAVCDYFPDFDYRNCVGDRSVLCDMRNPKNMVGHQQRAVTIFWAIEMCGPTDLGLDIGSHRGLTPFCIHVDRYYDGKNAHPVYGGVISADVVADGTKLEGLFPPNTFPYIASNHSLEHMANDVVPVVQSWIDLLRPGGILAMVVPDNDYWDVMSSDSDHKNAWGHTDFHRRVLDFVRGAEVVEYDTLDNHYSFNVILRKT